jgi:TonB family protein
VEAEIAGIWTRWESRVVDHTFPLERYLGGGEKSAVFLTQHNGRPAAVKLIRADPRTDDLHLARWQFAARLSHPQLLGIFACGRDDWDGTAMLYVAMEYAEENLSQVLPDRALTTLETLEMLPPVLKVLEYLHRQDLVHGRLKPSNIMAVDDRVKLSSDGILRAGEPIERGQPSSPYAAPEPTASPSSDVWSLGVTLVEVLTQRLPAPELPPGLFEPFVGIARRCLQANPRKRETIGAIAKRIGAPAGGKQWFRKLSYVLPLAAIALVSAAVLGRKAAESGTHAASPVPVTPAPVTTPVPVAPAPAAPPPAAPVKVARATKTPAPQPSGPAGVLDRVMPDIPAKARATIHGKLVVPVRVHVDSSGKVTDARLDQEPSSRYFSERTLKASRRWKFRPQDHDQDWLLRFVFVPSSATVSVERASSEQ